MVNDDFELVAFDFVSNPSTRGAFLEPVNLNESVDPTKAVTTEGRVCTKYCKVEGIIHEILGEIGESRMSNNSSINKLIKKLILEVLKRRKAKTTQ